MVLEKLVLAALLGAALELDSYFIGMLLISQPVIAGAAAGYIFGDLQAGLMLGCLVQVAWIMPPVGAYVPPSASGIAFTSAVCGIVMSGLGLPGGENSVYMYALIIGTAFGYFVGQMDVWNRKFNTLIMHRYEPQVRQARGIYILLIQAAALFVKYARDTVGYLIIFILGIPLAVKIYVSMPAEVFEGLHTAFWVMPILGFAVIFEMFRTKTGHILHGAVFLVSYAVFALYRNINPGLFMLAVITIGVFVVYNTVWKKEAAA